MCLREAQGCPHLPRLTKLLALMMRDLPVTLIRPVIIPTQEVLVFYVNVHNNCRDIFRRTTFYAYACTVRSLSTPAFVYQPLFDLS